MAGPKPNAFAGGMMGQVQPSGPTVEKFILDFEHRTKGIMGPVGGGKTTGCIMAIDVIAAIQQICTDGVIRSKGPVVRDTLRDLEKTVLPSWFEWFPKEMKDPVTGADMWEFTGGNDRPAIHTRRWKSPRGIIECITEFIGIGNHRIEDITRGAMWTWAWINEWDLVSHDVVMAIDQRLTRYPAKRMLFEPKKNDVIPFMLGDFNAPDIDNWTYKHMVEEPIRGYQLYMQPGGMEPNAENKHNLAKGYYENFLATKPAWWCHRFVHNKFGYSRVGQPVYGEFNEHKHVAKQELMPLPRVPLRVGIDGGGSPAAIIAQRAAIGQVRWLDEVVTKPITGPARFAAMILALLSKPKYHGCEVELLVYDPSAAYGVDAEAGEYSWIETVARALNVAAVPHWTNDPGYRQQAVRDLLETDIDGRIPSLLVSPTCRGTIAGMVHGYRIEHTRRTDPDSPLKDKVEKNEFSHRVEAGEYVTGSYSDRQGLINRAARVAPVMQQQFGGRVGGSMASASRGDFDPFRV